MVFWKIVDATVDLWTPCFPAYLPPVLELTGSPAHTPARGGILSDACIRCAVDEVTEWFDPSFGAVQVFVALCSEMIQFLVDWQG